MRARTDVRHLLAIMAALSVLPLSTAAAKGVAHAVNPATAPGAAQGDCDTPTTPFCDALMKPPPGWQRHVFKLAQDYPKTLPAPDAMPWRKFDPKTQGVEYLGAVLDYFYEGNIRDSVEDSFDPAKNTVRQWFNAPWQDYGKGGREFIHGLTRERVNEVQELAFEQTSRWNNYAVGFYNAPGGYVIGQVWSDHGKPDATKSNFPDGTVAAKLLFTTASVAEVPYLAGAPEWDAYVYDPHIDSAQIPDDPAKRKRMVMKVRLLQIDIAVKDFKANSPTGWVMGTFVYGAGMTGTPGAGWRNVAPIGIMWGNDPDYPTTGVIKETVLNAKVAMPHVGWEARLNGPVDNKLSACLSCHGTAEVTPDGSTMKKSGMIPKRSSDVMNWFRNVPSGTPFDAGAISTDYSLQLAGGIANFREQQKIAHATGAEKVRDIKEKNEMEKVSPRDGGEID